MEQYDKRDFRVDIESHGDIIAPLFIRLMRLYQKSMDLPSEPPKLIPILT